MNGTSSGTCPPNGAVSVVFISQRNGVDEAGYARAAQAMEQSVAKQPGYLGHVGLRDAGGLAITVSHWCSEADARAWRAQAEHAAIRALGRARWYASYELIVAQVARSESWPPQTMS